MDYATQIQNLISGLKGAPLAVLTLMIWARDWHAPEWTVEELKAGTGYTTGHSIANARLVLINRHLCEPVERGRIGLRLVDRAVQQLGLWHALPPVGEVVESEVQKMHLTPCSSSSFKLKEDRGSLTKPPSEMQKMHLTSEKPLLLPQSEIGKTDLTYPDLEYLVDLLAGCPRPRATRAVQAALERGDHPVWIEMEILWWTLYVSSPMGKSINGGMLFVAAKIEKDEECPDFLRGRPRSNVEWTDWRDKNRETLDHIDSLARKYARLQENNGVDPYDEDTEVSEDRS